MKEGPAERGTSEPGMPRWIKVSMLIALAVAVLVVVMLALGHGPGNHGQHTAASGASVTFTGSPSVPARAGTDVAA